VESHDDESQWLSMMTYVFLMENRGCQKKDEITDSVKSLEPWISCFFNVRSGSVGAKYAHGLHEIPKGGVLGWLTMPLCPELLVTMINSVSARDVKQMLQTVFDRL